MWLIQNAVRAKTFVALLLYSSAAVCIDSPAYPADSSPADNAKVSHRLRGATTHDRLKVWVVFNDKGISTEDQLQTALGAYESQMSARSQHRRTRRTDLPFPDHLDDAITRQMSQALAPRIRSWDRRAARQRQPDSLDHAGHRRGRTHGHAVAVRARNPGLGLQVIQARDAPGPQLGGKAIDIRSGTDILIAELAVEHRPARHRNGRQIHARRPHQTGWRRFVAAGQQHHSVERIGADAFLHVHARQVAVEHGSWLHHCLAERGNRKFERKAPGLVHAALDLLGQNPQMGVARV